MNRIAVFASGRGSNFQTIVHRIEDGYLPARVAVLVSDRPTAGAIAFAEGRDIPVAVVRPADFASPEQFGAALLAVLAPHDCRLLVLAGYLKKIPDPVVAAYANRIVNIHPALLPAFGGRGMYGMSVHRAVWASGARGSGVTVHLVNTVYDAGPIVLQVPVDIADCDGPESVAERVLAHEHDAFPRALKALLDSDYRVEGNRVLFGRSIHDPH